ncbi:MAG: hypothetical protein FIB00_00865 [Chloroflexi bacterium]|nr:hypothetical protein [Chloroflexota bacterium]
MSTKERLHRLIDEMNDDQAAVLLMDLEEPRPPLTDEEREAIATARQELRSGEGISLEEAMKRLRAAG